MIPIKYDPYVLKPVKAVEDCFIQNRMPVGEKLQAVSDKIVIENKGYQKT